MNPLDWMLLLLAALAVVLGWRIGLVCGAMALASVLVGAMAGFLLARGIVAAFDGLQRYDRSILVLVCLGCIALGQLFTSRWAQQLHDGIRWVPARAANSAGGAVLTLLFGTAMVWMLATALALAPSTAMATLMRGSAVLVGLDRATSGDAGMLFNQLEATAGINSQPRIFTGLGLLPAPLVELPAPQDVTGEQLAAAASVVRVVGRARCGPTLAGSGVVVARDLVMTNAHVVAGVRDPLVFARDATFGMPAVPVVFDPVRDIALLRVAGLHLPALRLGVDPGPSQLLAAAGYPNAGGQQLQATRVRDIVMATGSDIFGREHSRRRVVVIAGDIIPGDSGGPLLSREGAVVGLVFASALTGDGHTGYALSASEATAALASPHRYRRVSTGGCVPG